LMVKWDETGDAYRQFQNKKKPQQKPKRSKKANGLSREQEVKSSKKQRKAIYP